MQLPLEAQPRFRYWKMQFFKIVPKTRETSGIITFKLV